MMDFASQYINSFKIYIANAKIFLLENPTKKPIYTITVFGISSQTLYYLIAFDKEPISETQKIRNKTENNKIFEKH